MSCEGCEISFMDFCVLSNNKDELFDFLINHNVLLKNKDCPNCGKVLSVSNLQFRCRALVAHGHKKMKKCEYRQTVRKNTFFDGHRLDISKICRFVCLDILRSDGDTTFLVKELKWCTQSVVDFKSFLREVYIDWASENERPTIGGPGKIVEIDETKVGKRKYNCGRIVEGQWLFGAIERDSGEFIVVPVESRNKETLLSIIEERVAEGSTIISDCWKSYDCLKDEGFQDQTVNHSKNFVDPDSLEHTQNFERIWRDVKGFIPRYGRRNAHYIGYLARLKFFKTFPDYPERLHQIFKAIGKLYDPKKENIIVKDILFEEDPDDLELDV